jgi:hypothetical protein
MKVLSASILFMIVLPWIAFSQTEKPAIYVSAPIRNGFHDSNTSIQESIQDIKDQLHGKKGIRVVNEKEKADILLTIVSRGIGPVLFSKRLEYKEQYNSVELSTIPIIYNTAWISAILQAGDYKKELIGTDVKVPGESTQIWQNCAKEIAGNVVAWAKANAVLRAKEESLADAFGKLRGKIAEIAGDVIYINLGSQNQISVGDTLEIVNLVKIVKDPDSGQPLSEITEYVGKLRIEKVEMKSSICKVLQAEKTIRVGQIVRDSNSALQDRWNDAERLTAYVLRLENNVLYLEADLSEVARHHGDSLVGQLNRQGSSFKGTLKDAFRCELNDNSEIKEPKSKMCSFEYGVELTPKNSNLIEGLIQGPPVEAQFDCGSCRWSKTPIYHYIKLTPQKK